MNLKKSASQPDHLLWLGPLSGLHEEGGNGGPDLTGSNRANLDYILAEIINPSEIIQGAYHLVVVITRDGRTVSGIVAAEDAQ